MAIANSYVQLTSLAAAKVIGLSVANGGSATPDAELPAEAVGAYLQAETQNVRFRCDGTAPTTTVGTLLTAGAAPTLIMGKQNLVNLKVIETTASAKLNIQFIGRHL